MNNSLSNVIGLGCILINDLINDQINLLYKNTHIRKAVDGCPDIALSFRSLQEVVKDHLIQTFRNNVKSKFAVDDRVELLKAKIATAVQSYRELSDINIIINSYCDYEIRVEQLQSSCVDIKNELTSLAEIKNKIDEELRIDEDSLPDAAALDKLKGNLPLARMFNDAANSGVPVGKYVSVDSLTVGGQSLQVSLPSSTKNLCHQSFIHRVNLFLLDKDSVASPTDNVAEINFDSLIRTLTNDQLNEYVLEIDKCLKEMDGLLGNKYHLANAIALYLHEFISQPAEQQTKENLDKIISKCQHKLHSYDSEVAEQDKSLWERKLTIVIGIIPIIGQIVLAANYFYNKHTSGIGFFSWETSKKQDAQRKVDTALDALGEMMMVPTPTA